MDTSYDFGLVGLGVMGRNFLLNVADHGFSVYGHDLDTHKVESLLSEKSGEHKLYASAKAEDLIKALSRPRKIMMLVPAGNAVDGVIESLLPLLDPGDILIDGGNSFYRDTDRREGYLKAKGLNFFGAGVSGGAKGARFGPSIMPGGSANAYEQVRPIFEAVAAKYNGEPCVAYLGPKSAGNYVKMVHNGIEYGLMQLTAECYDLLKQLGNCDNEELQKIFSEWNEGRLQSFLVEISAQIFGKTDDLGPGALIDQILDKAKQKGTGKWTSQNAMDLGVPVPTIDMAVSMREISAMKAIRQQAEKAYPPKSIQQLDKHSLIKVVESALYFGFVITYAQGLHQLEEASKEYGYNLDMAVIARIWRAGCIIRAALLQDIAAAFSDGNAPKHLLLTPAFVSKVKETVADTRAAVGYAVQAGVPLPGISNALSYFDAFTSGRLPMNLVQAQRDFFGSHTYERKDREGTFHTDWSAGND